MKTPPLIRSAGFSLALFFLLAAHLSSAAETSKISLNVSPGSATLLLGQSQQFRASMSGTTRTEIHWLVNGIRGGSASLGTVSASGLYKAPLSMPSNRVRVTAQSATYHWISASASLTFTASMSNPVSLSVSPSSASVQVSHSQQFSATVSGTSNTAVNWLVNGTLGGNTTLGTVSTSGLYTAPSTVPSQSVSVTAQSVAQSTATASASVLVAPATISVSISPLGVSLQVGQSQQFSATVSGSGNTSVNWLVSGVAGGNSSVGTISTAGLYNAPSTVPGGSVVVTARSAANPNSSASTTVSISQPVDHSVQLSWSDGGSNIAGYYIYRSTNAAGPFSKLNSSPDTATGYTDTTVVSGQTYYYATTAVSSAGVESAYSNLASASVP